MSLPKNTSIAGPVVIHVQDVHMNQEAQWNIRETVKSLLQSGQVGLVALEGATEEINLQAFVNYPHAKAVEMAADYLLKENKISGPIHAALTARGQLPRILGVDDPAHYEANVQAYRDSAPKREKIRQEVLTIQKEIETQKRVVFSSALQSFDRQVQHYRDGKCSLGDYVRLLANEADPDRIGKGTRNFLTALAMERSLDFKRVESERARLIERLTQTLTAEETNTLVAQSLDYRAGHLRYGEFYEELRTLCEKKGISLKSYPALDSYVKYVLMSDGIDAEQLMTEIATLEKNAYGRQLKTSEEKSLASRSREVWLTGKLLDFSLIPAEWDEYDANPRPRAHEALVSFENFYKEAHARDVAMANNLLQAMKNVPSLSKAEEVPVTLLVTGGFHAEGLAQRLTQQGITVISYIPKIEKIDTAQGSTYLSVFTQEKSPLEKLFVGEKLFLAQVPIKSVDRKTILPIAVIAAAVFLGYVLLNADINGIYHSFDGWGVLRGISFKEGMFQVIVALSAGTAIVKMIGNPSGINQAEIKRGDHPESGWWAKILAFINPSAFVNSLWQVVVDKWALLGSLMRHARPPSDLKEKTIGFYTTDGFDLELYVSLIRHLRESPKEMPEYRRRMFRALENGTLQTEMAKIVEERIRLGFPFNPARLDTLLTGQTETAYQAVVELINNGYDAMGDAIGRFGRGVYQAVGLLKNEGDHLRYISISEGDNNRRYGVEFVRAGGKIRVNFHREELGSAQTPGTDVIIALKDPLSQRELGKYIQKKLGRSRRGLLYQGKISYTPLNKIDDLVTLKRESPRYRLGDKGVRFWISKKKEIHVRDSGRGLTSPDQTGENTSVLFESLPVAYVSTHRTPADLRRALEALDPTANGEEILIKEGAQKKGVLRFEVGGTEAETVELEGENLSPEIIIDLPTAADQTEARGRIMLNDPVTLNALKKILREVVAEFKERPEAIAPVVNALFVAFTQMDKAERPKSSDRRDDITEFLRGQIISALSDFEPGFVFLPAGPGQFFSDQIPIGYSAVYLNEDVFDFDPTMVNAERVVSKGKSVWVADLNKGKMFLRIGKDLILDRKVYRHFQESGRVFAGKGAIALNILFGFWIGYGRKPTPETELLGTQPNSQINGGVEFDESAVNQMLNGYSEVDRQFLGPIAQRHQLFGSRNDPSATQKLARLNAVRLNYEAKRGNVPPLTGVRVSQENTDKWQGHEWFVARGKTFFLETRYMDSQSVYRAPEDGSPPVPVEGLQGIKILNGYIGITLNLEKDLKDFISVRVDSTYHLRRLSEDGRSVGSEIKGLPVDSHEMWFVSTIHGRRFVSTYRGDRLYLLSKDNLSVESEILFPSSKFINSYPEVKGGNLFLALDDNSGGSQDNNTTLWTMSSDLKTLIEVEGLKNAVFYSYKLYEGPSDNSIILSLNDGDKKILYVLTPDGKKVKEIIEGGDNMKDMKYFRGIGVIKIRNASWSISLHTMGPDGKICEEAISGLDNQPEIKMPFQAANGRLYVWRKNTDEVWELCLLSSDGKSIDQVVTGLELVESPVGDDGFALNEKTFIRVKLRGRPGKLFMLSDDGRSALPVEGSEIIGPLMSYSGVAFFKNAESGCMYISPDGREAKPIWGWQDKREIPYHDHGRVIIGNRLEKLDPLEDVAVDSPEDVEKVMEALSSLLDSNTLEESERLGRNLVRYSWGHFLQGPLWLLPFVEGDPLRRLDNQNALWIQELGLRIKIEDQRLLARFIQQTSEAVQGDARFNESVKRWLSIFELEGERKRAVALLNLLDKTHHAEAGEIRGWRMLSEHTPPDDVPSSFTLVRYLRGDLNLTPLTPVLGEIMGKGKAPLSSFSGIRANTRLLERGRFLTASDMWNSIPKNGYPETEVEIARNSGGGVGREWIRENIQNGIKAALRARVSPKIDVTAVPLIENRKTVLRVSTRDNGDGMDAYDIANFLLALDSSSFIEGDDRSHGFNGRGWFKNLAGSDRVRVISGKRGAEHHHIFEVRKEIVNGRTMWRVARFAEEKGEFVGTDMQWEKEYEGPYESVRDQVELAVSLMGDDLLTFTGLLPETLATQGIQLQINFQGKPLSDQSELLASVKWSENETVRLVRRASGKTGVYQKGYFVMDLWQVPEIWDLVPDGLKKTVNGLGLSILLPESIPIDRERLGLSGLEGYLPKFKKALLYSILQAAGRELSFGGLAVDYLYRPEHLTITPSRSVTQLADDLNNGRWERLKPNAGISLNPEELTQLLPLLKFPIGDGTTWSSLAEIRKKFCQVLEGNRTTFEPQSLPARLHGLYESSMNDPVRNFALVNEEDDRWQYQSGPLSPAQEKLVRFIKGFMEPLVGSYDVSFGDTKVPRIAIYGPQFISLKNASVTRWLNWIERKWAGQTTPDEDYAMVWRIVETVIHENTHAHEGISEETHNDRFYDAMQDTFLRMVEEQISPEEIMEGLIQSRTKITFLSGVRVAESPSTLSRFWRLFSNFGTLDTILRLAKWESAPFPVAMGLAIGAHFLLGASLGWAFGVAVLAGALGGAHWFGTYGMVGGKLQEVVGKNSLGKALSWFLWTSAFGVSLYLLGSVLPQDIVAIGLFLVTWGGTFLGVKGHGLSNREWVVNNIPDLTEPQRGIAREILKNLEGRPITLDMNQMRELVVLTAENAAKRQEAGTIDLSAPSARSSAGIKLMFVSQASLTAKALGNLRDMMARDENVFVLSDGPVLGISNDRMVVVPFGVPPQGQVENFPFQEVTLTEVRRRLDALAPAHPLRHRSTEAVSLFHTSDLEMNGDGLDPKDPLALAAKNPMVLLLESFRAFPFFNQAWQDSLKALRALAEFA